MITFLRRHLSIKNVPNLGLIMSARQPKGSGIKPTGLNDATLASLIISKLRLLMQELKDYSNVKNKSPGNPMYHQLITGLHLKEYGT